MAGLIQSASSNDSRAGGNSILSFDHYSERLRALDGKRGGRNCTIDGASLASPPESPLLTIVTVSFNSERSISRTIRSVMEQTYRNIEYVIIDGGSTDGTVGLIREWEERLSYWHSAKDRGISDAFNLGIAAAHGTYVAFVNSDDWMSRNQAEVAIAALVRTRAAFVFGRLAYHDVHGTLKYYMDGKGKYWEDIHFRMPHINHPTVVMRRDAYERLGGFDLNRRIAMDYDLHLRAELAGIRGVYVPEMVGNMSEGGTSDSHWEAGLREVRQIATEHTGKWLTAWSAYLARSLRGRIRLAMGHVAPKWLVDAIHRIINPRYLPLDRPGRRDH
jgi:glycosyltransferase involved in cell wall biosynthesis